MGYSFTELSMNISKIKLFVIFLIVLLSIFSVSILILSSHPDETQPLLHKALKVIINQSREGELSVKNISVDDIYPSDYKLNFTSDFYTINILDEKEKVLFTGKEKNRLVITSDSFAGNSFLENNSRAISYWCFTSGSVIISDSSISSNDILRYFSHKEDI